MQRNDPCEHGYRPNELCPWCKPAPAARKTSQRRTYQQTRRTPDFQIDEALLAEYVRDVYSWLPPGAGRAAGIADWKAGDVHRWQARRAAARRAALEVQETLL